MIAEERERIEKLIAKIANPAERYRRESEEHRRLFGKWDQALDSTASGPTWLLGFVQKLLGQFDLSVIGLCPCTE
jgi:hypothetical protein